MATTMFHSGAVVPAPTRAGDGELRIGLRDRLVDALLRPIDRVLHFIGPRYSLFFWIVAHVPPPVLAWLGDLRARRAVRHALRRVPAYAAHVAAGEGPVIDVAGLTVPETDKVGYVKAHPLPGRCTGGALPSRNVVIDESSGSTGQPFNWVRTADERLATHVFVSHFARYDYGDGPFVSINAFSMGAWATGLNMGVAMERTTVVKSTGPDIDKILATLEYLGPARPYLICGYPPFLKALLDEADRRGFPLDEYHLDGLVGGEGMSEGLRDYLMGPRRFRRVFSGYGATDIEIGLAGETPVCVAIRRIAHDNGEVRRALFGDDSRLPMVFQYNPLQHHVTVNDVGELIFTINRLEVLAPRIAYNVHDKGGVATFADVMAVLTEHGIDPSQLPGCDAAVPFPFLWIHGRSDATISVMGANIYPEDLEQALYDHPDVARAVSSYLLRSVEQPDGTIRPELAFATEHPTAALQERIEAAVVPSMIALNADLRTAMGEHPDAVRPVVSLHAPGTGPFAADSGKIKQTRLVVG
jgi:phenylacetate-CoA ligase